MRKKSVQMYDAFEAMTRYGFSLQIPASRVNAKSSLSDELQWADVKDIALQLVDRLKFIDQARWLQYSTWIQHFDEETNLLAAVELLDIPDTGIGFIPQNCKLRQLVIQRTPKFPQDHRYTISLDLWLGLSLEGRAAAIIHEILYREAIMRNPQVQTSEPVRYFNATILSNQIQKYSPADYQNLMSVVFGN